MNTPGLENTYSWRTRLADFVAAERPVITNGGDPLGEQVLAAGGALRVNDQAGDLAEVVRGLRAHPERHTSARRALSELRPRFSWAETTAVLATTLTSIDAPYAAEDSFVREHHLIRRSWRPVGSQVVLLRASHLAGRLRSEGARGSAAVLRDRLAPRLTHLQERLLPRRSGDHHDKEQQA